MRFTKMQGAGNDYIYINCFEESVSEPEKLAVRLSDRHFGIGGDGIVLIMPSEKADVRMRMFNADGSEGKMCGNASRCIGKYVYDRGIVKKKNILLETLSGIKKLEIITDENDRTAAVSVDMGSPEFSPPLIPMTADGESFIDSPVEINGKTVRMTAVSMGNPHAVIFVDDVSSLDLEAVGHYYENAPIFPERVNTEFVRVINGNTLEMRVWERGSGETLACGTGACASAAAACVCGHCRRGEDITVRLIGGELKINYTESGNIIMTGGAEFVFDGEI